MSAAGKTRWKCACFLASACMALLFLPEHAEAQQGQGAPARLSEIAGAIESYRDATVTMKLKLKTVDTVFERIVFYDQKNHDIVFDISRRETKKRLKRQMMNIHEGMDYFVTFKVVKTDNSGLVMAELVDFRPAVLDRIP